MKFPVDRERIPRSFYDRPTPIVARELLGSTLVRKIGKTWVGGRIVETEAYLAKNDLASHSARGLTPRNASMFMPPGTLYVYSIHAKYCMNVVTEPQGRGSAVLIRAIEPLWGLSLMKRNRGQDQVDRLTRGPAMLCQALGVDRKLDGIDLIEHSAVAILPSEVLPASRITTTPRIGISKSQTRRLRFFIDGNIYVSGRRADHRRLPAAH